MTDTDQAAGRRSAPRPSRDLVAPRRTRQLVNAVVVSVLLIGAIACGASALVSTDAKPIGTDSAVDPPIALVITDTGLAGVPVGTSTPRWVVPGAVAAPDGSAIFVARTVSDAAGDGFEVRRVDPRTGAEESVGRHVPGPARIRVAAVAPDGDKVALVAPIGEGTPDERTLVLDFDPERGGAGSKPIFEGRVEPEAFSLDQTRLYAARIYENGYHVHVLDLATGTQWPTVGSTPKPETMYGSVVQAVLSPDRTQLATLYRDSTKPDHTAFVHLLRLDDARTVCIDLHAPFGSDVAGTDAIAWQPDGTVVVGHRDPAGDQSVVATFDPNAIWAGPPQEHHHAEMRPAPTPPSVAPELIATPGFVRFVALVA